MTPQEGYHRRREDIDNILRLLDLGLCNAGDVMVYIAFIERYEHQAEFPDDYPKLKAAYARLVH